MRWFFLWHTVLCIIFHQEIVVIIFIFISGISFVAASYIDYYTVNQQGCVGFDNQCRI